MSDERKPWEIPVIYHDDRWALAADAQEDEPEERDARDAEELLHRGPRDERVYECKDQTPIDYTKGPHDEEFGVDESAYDAPDDDSVPIISSTQEDD